MPSPGVYTPPQTCPDFLDSLWHLQRSGKEIFMFLHKQNHKTPFSTRSKLVCYLRKWAWRKDCHIVHSAIQAALPLFWSPHSYCPLILSLLCNWVLPVGLTRHSKPWWMLATFTIVAWPVSVLPGKGSEGRGQLRATGNTAEQTRKECMFSFLYTHIIHGLSHTDST